MLTPEIMQLSVVCDVFRNHVQVHDLRASQPLLTVKGKGATYSMELMTEGTPEKEDMNTEGFWDNSYLLKVTA